MNMIAVVGESGSGKTSSIRNLDPASTFIISTTGKRPGIQGSVKKYPAFAVKDGQISGNFYVSANADKISKMLQLIDKKMPWIKVVVIDDVHYVSGFEALERAKETGYTRFTEMAQHTYQVLKEAMGMRDDISCVVMSHQTNTGSDDMPQYAMKTIGKMISNIITLEGLFTYVLFTRIIKDAEGKFQYKFMVNSDGTTTAKTPMGLFNEMYIDNDLDYVIRRINEYNEE